MKDIHQKNLVHRDFHSGNILNNDLHSFITDLGLCKPVNETSQEDKIYGVMPYVAPEILQSKPYTQASDIYSFGIVAYEILSGLPPYCDKSHDTSLGLATFQGLRPQLNIKVPQLLEDLIKRCWDTDHGQRPTANELNRILSSWVDEVSSQKNNEFFQQFNDREQFLNNLTSLDYKIHPSAFYTSRLLDFKNLPRPQNSKEVNDMFYIASQSLYNTDLQTLSLDMNSLIQDASEEERNIEQQTAQIQHNPFKK